MLTEMQKLETESDGQRHTVHAKKKKLKELEDAAKVAAEETPSPSLAIN